MSDAIDRAARAEAERKGRDEYWCGDPDVFAAGAEWAVAHLREATQGDATEQAAKVITAMGGKWADRTPLSIARALAEAGLLAPATLREVQAEAWAECSQWHAEQGMPVNGAGDEHNPYRAEGDGRAEREPTVPASQLRAFARLCVDGGDMTPAAARMLDRIIDGDGRAEK